MSEDGAPPEPSGDATRVAATPSLRKTRPDAQVRSWTRRQLASSPPRTQSLIITVWGDSIAPHGGAVMLPGIIELLAPFGLNERLVRTNVFRLVRQNWLQATRVGRRSLYRLTPDGERRFEEAHRRIYAVPDGQWNNGWELVVGNGLPAGKRRMLTKELKWAGFGEVAPCIFARPSHGKSTLAAILTALGLADKVVVAQLADDASLGGQPLHRLVPTAWDLATVATAYRRFLQRFGKVIECFRKRDPGTFDPEQCFVVRTLLIHAYRRVLLRDPQLPAALLPLDWPAAAALALCRDFYRLTHRAAERHLAATLESADGALPPAASWFYQRCGGL